LRSALGLSPAIALAQNETQPSTRSTVASLTDLGELLGVLYARFGDKRCPEHDLPTEARSLDEIVAHVRSQSFGRTLAITVTLAEQKKGQFRKQLEDFAKKGYTRAWIDGAATSLEPLPLLAKDEKHDIAILIDVTKVEPSREARLRRSLETALQLGQGIVTLYQADSQARLEVRTKQHLSMQAGCPQCAFSWPKLDTRHFSPNSLGRCPTCEGRGQVIDDEEEAESIDDLPPERELCRVCLGTGLLIDLKAILFRGRSIHRHYQSTILELRSFFAESRAGLSADQAAQRLVVDHVLTHLDRLLQVGLGYLHLGRRIRSLSNGEAQRLRLSSILSEQLRGVLYVLDEPSQGLHPTEIDRIWQAIERLKAQGNTVLIVDHDPQIMRKADWIVDLGPGGGREGGQLLAKFQPQEASAFREESITARYLSQTPTLKVKAQAQASTKVPAIQVNEARLHHLRIPSVRFPLGQMTVVTGPSGAGKTSLVLGTLYRNLASQLQGAKAPWYHCKNLHGWQDISSCTLITRKPIAKSSVSMPATYLDIFTDLRNLFASVPEAQIYGLHAGSFSLSQDEGRCPECKGRGTLVLSMKFLADAAVSCPLCLGGRYKPHILDVRYAGLNMANVLDLSIAETLETFAHHRSIQRRLQPAVALGLGYLKLGQPSSSLSGGESQRLKLVPYLARRVQPGTVLIMDEPTAGLHFRDVELLLGPLQDLVNQGVTLIIIEHDAQVIAAADWLIRLGPESGEQGGQLVYEGVPRSEDLKF
jgi:excinuclease ABC subunit A